MDRKYIDDHHIVARYLADQLPDQEREAFEAYYLEHPEMVREMEAAARLKVGLAQLEQSGELTALLQPKPWFRQERYQALAASVAVAALAVFLFVSRGPASQPLLVASATALTDRLGDPLATAATYTVLRTRSMSYDAEIELPASAQTIGLRVLPEVEPHAARYRVTLSSVADDDTLREIATVGGLEPDAADGFVPVYLNSARLAPGRYQLMLSGEEAASTGTPKSAFLIRVVDDTP